VKCIPWARVTSEHAKCISRTIVTSEHDKCIPRIIVTSEHVKSIPLARVTSVQDKGIPQTRVTSEHLKCIPQARVTSKYDKCAIPTLVRGVVGWLHDAPEFFPNIEKTFFSFIEDNHRLCVGYTEDPIPHSGITCGIPDEPRYFIIDLNVLYFKHATFNKEAWKNKIINNRRSCTEELYYLDSGDIISDDICGTKFSPPYKNVNADGETIPSARTSYQGYVGYGRVIPYRTRYRKETPAVLWSAISNNDFDALWLQDAFAFNGRNDLFKWNFNHWSRIGTYSEDGWVCGWNISEQLGAAGLSQSEIQAQGQQYYNLMGGGDISDTSSSDTEYVLLQPIEDGYSYDKFLEPLPKRESAFGLS